MTDPHLHDDDHDDHGGLSRDMPHLLERRQALRWMGGVSLAGILAACTGGDGVTTLIGGESTTSTAAATPTDTAAATSTTMTPLTSQAVSDTTAVPGAEIPDEAGGPFPADGTNGPNVLTDGAVLKSDITTSFGGLSGTADGVPVSFEMTVVDAATGSAMPGAVVYIWHCTADGVYSIYEDADQNYLRGTQVTDAAGRVTFSSIFPGCYPGRWPHAHFEVYASPDEASSGSRAIKTSQLALPQADCEAVYVDSRYGESAEFLSQLALSSDIVFRDGWTDQLAVVSGSIDAGLTASLLVRV